MKKMNWLLMLLAAVAVSFASCEPTPTPEPEPEPKPSVTTFDVQIGEVTSSSVAYTVTPSNLEAEYLCVLYDAATVEEFTREEFLVQSLLMDLESEARAVGKTLLEYMPSVVDKGVIEDGLYSQLRPESEYYIVVFGVDPADGYQANTAVSKTKVTTLAGPSLDVTFDIQTEVDGNSAKYTVTPSNNDDVWYFYTVPSNTFAAYTDPEGGYRMSEQSFLLYCLQREIDAYRQMGLSDNQIMNTVFHKGALQLSAEGLNANTEYTNMVAGFVVTPEGQVTIATELTTSTYTTGDAKAKNLTFKISVTDVEPMRAAIKITPSNNTDTFCWLCGQWDGVQTAEQVMNDIVAMYGGWMNGGYAMIYKGVQDYTGGPGSPKKFGLEAPDTDYYVIAFGYAGGVTSAPEMVTFHSLPAPAPEDTTFKMTASSVSPYGFTVGITPSENTTYYTFNVMANAAYDEINIDELVEELNAQFDEALAMQQAADPNVTAATVLSMYYYRGAYTVTASGLTPETTCSGFAMALSPETGHVVKVHTFPNIATTGKLGEIQPAIEVVGHYSGDDENGSIFGKPAATRGKAITVLKCSEFDGASKLYGTMVGDDVTNASTYPDAEIWGDLTDSWGEVNMSQPYLFIVVGWDAPQTGFTYAVDANGNPGALGRCFSMATVDNKGNIEELKALVDKINAQKSSFALPKSLVFGEGMKLDVERVEVPAQVAEPKAEPKAEVAMPELRGNVVMTSSYIRPFYL